MDVAQEDEDRQRAGPGESPEAIDGDEGVVMKKTGGKAGREIRPGRNQLNGGGASMAAALALAEVQEGKKTKVKVPKIDYVRTVRGVEALPGKRNAPYRKEIFTKSTTVTIYGPIDIEPDASWLTKVQKKSLRAAWSYGGHFHTLRRGKAAQRQLQGRWGDPYTMAILNACSHVRRYSTNWLGHDGRLLRRTLVDIIQTRDKNRMSKFAAAVLCPDYDGEVTTADRVSCAVVEAAEIHGRPPSRREAFDQFVETGNAEGREGTPNLRTFYRDLKEAGWGWL